MSSDPHANGRFGVAGVLLACAFAGFASCRDATPQRVFTVRDSAGIDIRESTAPAWDPESAWRIDAEPEVMIGQREGDPRYLLGDVVGARRLTDGRIVIADMMGLDLRVYSPRGEHLHDVGGEGEGPGEFRSLSYFEVTGDTLVVYSHFPPTVSRFLADGTFLESKRIYATGHAALKSMFLFGYLFDAGYAIGTTSPDREVLEFTDGLNRLPRPLWRFRLDGSEFIDLAEYDGAETVIERSGSTTRYTSYPFGKSTALTTSRNAIYVAPTEDYAVYVYDVDYRLRRIVRRPFTAPRTTARDMARWVDAQIEYFDPDPEEEPAFRRNRELDYAPTMPALKSMSLDPLGNLWIEEWPGSLFEAGDFTVFSPEGRWLGRVELPEDRAPSFPPVRGPWLEFGADYVPGVWRDAFDVDQVRLYRIRKPELVYGS